MDVAARPATAQAAQRRPPPRSFWQRYEDALTGTIAVAVFLAGWEAAVQFGWVNPLFTSSPSRIAATAVQMFADRSIFYDLQVSGFEFTVGYGLAILLGSSPPSTPRRASPSCRC